MCVSDDQEVVTAENSKFRKMSHHQTDNSFHHFEFGSNINNIHLATPGEMLHMHQLGVAK